MHAYKHFKPTVLAALFLQICLNTTELLYANTTPPPVIKMNISNDPSTTLKPKPFAIPTTGIRATVIFATNLMIAYRIDQKARQIFAEWDPAEAQKLKPAVGLEYNLGKELYELACDTLDNYPANGKQVEWIEQLKEQFSKLCGYKIEMQLDDQVDTSTHGWFSHLIHKIKWNLNNLIKKIRRFFYHLKGREPLPDSPYLMTGQNLDGAFKSFFYKKQHRLVLDYVNQFAQSNSLWIDSTEPEAPSNNKIDPQTKPSFEEIKTMLKDMLPSFTCNSQALHDVTGNQWHCLLWQNNQTLITSPWSIFSPQGELLYLADFKSRKTIYHVPQNRQPVDLDDQNPTFLRLERLKQEIIKGCLTTMLSDPNGEGQAAMLQILLGLQQFFAPHIMLCATTELKTEPEPLLEAAQPLDQEPNINDSASQPIDTATQSQAEIV